MNILIISRGIPSAHDPQEGCFEMDQAQALASLGHHVMMMSVDGRIRKYWRKIGLSEYKLGSVHAFKLFLFPTAIVRHCFSYKMGYKIEAFLSRHLYNILSRRYGPFDIVHSHYLPCTYYAASIKRKSQINLVATEHWGELGKQQLSHLVEYLGNHSYSYVDELISVSNTLRQTIKAHFKKDSTVIHNIINTEFLKNCKKDFDADICRITCVGSLVAGKGFDFLIESFVRSVLSKRHTIINIIGSGSDYRRLKNLIIKYGIEDKVKLLGQLNRREIYYYLHESDFFVLPSRHENFSVAVLEALANGVPVIATVCGGIRECITNKNGLLVPVDDIDAMVNALNEMYDNRNKYNRVLIQKECLERFSPIVIGNR